MRICVIGAGACGLVAASREKFSISHFYKVPDPFQDRRVLVVGAGNSGERDLRRLLKLAGPRREEAA